MKWGQKRGSRARSQKACRMFVGLLLVVALVVSGVRIPVAQAGVFYGIGDVGMDFSYPSFSVNTSGVDHSCSQQAGDILVSGPGDWQWGQCYYYMESWTISMTMDGAAAYATYCDAHWSPSSHVVDNICVNTSWSTGVHHIVGSASWSKGGIGYTWSFDYTGNISQYIAPVVVEISGPSAVDTTVGGTWTATAAGGTSPYTYLWSYGLTSGFPTNATTYYGSTLSAVLASGTNTVQVTAADAADPQGSAVASASVVSADEVASYHIKLQRVGSVGQYIEATAWDNTGQAVEITGTADSEIAIYTAAPDPVGFNWTTIDEAVAVNNSLAWRWSGWGGFGQEHQWFKSTITITGGHAIPVTAEFVGLGQNIDVWVTPDDTQIGAPVPPAVQEVEPVWITQAKGILLWLGNTLFVPTQAQLDSLLPSGSLGASLLEGTAWSTGASTWTMHTHWDGHEIVLINVNFADLGVFGSRVKTIVQAGICMALIYMVVVLL